MSEPFEDGGPAFPCEGGDLPGLHAAPGMTLRDWFAGQALTGFLAASSDYKIFSISEIAERTAAAAASSYRVADAMLKARSQP